MNASIRIVTGIALSVAASTVSAQAPEWCGTILTEEMAKAALELQAAGIYDAPPGIAGEYEVVYVPLTMHIVRRDDGTGGLPLERLEGAVNDANIHFAGMGIQFCISGEIDYIDDTYFYEGINSEAGINELRNTNKVEGTINCYFVEYFEFAPGFALCGISAFTFSSPQEQGIVMANPCTSTSNDKSTFAHELGHYFDLFHTHETAFGAECADGSNCDSAGDLVCDTPADPLLGFNNVNSNTCQYTGSERDDCNNTLYAPEPRNIMAYSPSNCQDLFTPEQNARGRATLFNGRPELINACPTGASLVRVSVNSRGRQSNGDSNRPDISNSGDYVVFDSIASNLAADDANGLRDVFIHDRTRDRTDIVSVSDNGTPGNGESSHARISATGQFVVFHSLANNFGTEDTNNTHDIFIRDVKNGRTELISRQNGQQRAANGQSLYPHVSATGRYVAFQSTARNLTSTNDTNGSTTDIFVHDRDTGVTTLVSVSSSGTQGNNHSYSPVISGDGRYVAFYSYATNLVPGDTNAREDVFLHDLQTGETTLVSKNLSGGVGNARSCCPDISDDGMQIAFHSSASNLVGDDTNAESDVFVLDRESGLVGRVSLSTDGAQGDDVSLYPRISPEGRFVVYQSLASTLVSGDGNRTVDIFVTDRDPDLNGVYDESCEGCRETKLLSRSASGLPGNLSAEFGAISLSQLVSVFSSFADNLVEEDTNGSSDVFLTWKATGPYTVSVNELIVGQPATFTIVGATPYRTQYLAGSVRGLGETFVPQLNVTLGLRRPVLVGTADADAVGDAQLDVTPGANLGGRNVWFQVAEEGRATEAVAGFVEE